MKGGGEGGRQQNIKETRLFYNHNLTGTEILPTNNLLYRNTVRSS